MIRPNSLSGRESVGAKSLKTSQRRCSSIVDDWRIVERNPQQIGCPRHLDQSGENLDAGCEESASMELRSKRASGCLECDHLIGA